MSWYDNEDPCKNCKFYSESDNGWCEYKAKFVDENNHCERYAEGQR